MRRAIALATLGGSAIALATLGGCATIVAGGPDSIPISTNPPGAYVYVNGEVVGQTPLVVNLERSRRVADIRIYYPGFQPVQLARYKTFNSWVFGNFCLGIWPLVIDLATGNWQRFEDEPIAIGLTPGQAPPPYGVQPIAPQPIAPQPMQPQPMQPAPQPMQPAPQPMQPAPQPMQPQPMQPQPMQPQPMQPQPMQPQPFPPAPR